MSKILLKATIAKKDNTKVHTHTWFGHGEYPYRLSLTEEATIQELYQSLFNLFKNPKKEGKWNSITEKVPTNKIIRLFADLDFEAYVSVGRENFKEEITELLLLYKKTVEKYIEEEIDEWYVATRMLYKFHIHFPTVIVSTKSAKAINEAFRKAFQEHPLLKEIYKPAVVDSSVYNTGLRMLWCHKGNMVSKDKLQEVIKEHHKALSTKVEYEHSYYLVDPITLEPLPPSIEHLEKTSILTDEKVRYEVSVEEVPYQVQQSTENKLLEKDKNTALVEKGAENQYKELTEETRIIVRSEIVRNFTCYIEKDINKIIDYTNYLVAAISRKTCPIKGGDHSKNHPYVVICSNGLQLKCHNINCKALGSTIYPISIELQKALEEHGKRLIPFAEGYLIKGTLASVYIPQWRNTTQSAFTAYLNNYVAMYMGPNGEQAYLSRSTPMEPWVMVSKEKIRDRLDKFNVWVDYNDDEGKPKSVYVKVFETWHININRREIKSVVLDTKYVGDDPEDPTVWNVWSGFAVKPARVFDMETIEPILYHLREVYCTGDSVKYEYLLNWFAHLVKQPARKIGTAIILKGEQGAGKNIVLDWFGRCIVGMTHYHEYNSMEDLLNHFNADSAYKIFCICNEISNYGGCIKTNDILKNRITNTRIRIEKKGIDAVSVDDYQNFIFTTNNNWVVRITPDDRRYIIFQTSSIHKQDGAYFKKLADCLDKDETKKAFLGFLFSRKLNCVCGKEYVNDETQPLVNVHEAIWTDEKRDLLMLSKDSVTTFVEAIFNNDYHMDKAIYKADTVEMTNEDLYTAYCDFHDNGNYFARKLDKDTFSKSFPKELEKYPGRFKSKSLGPKKSRKRGWLMRPFEKTIDDVESDSE